MISKGDKIIFGIIAACLILIFVFWKDVQAVALGERGVEKIEKEHKEKKKDKTGKKDDQDHSAPIVSEVSILKRWELPAELKEVSGIAYMDDQRFACVQDEEGKIFVFNRATEKIEREIPFAGSGDYEGIALKGNIAYVLRADGVLYEVNMEGGNTSGKEYKTALTVEHNVEGLTYDKTNDRLLLAIKDDEPGNRDYKGIYAFDLSKKEFNIEPAFKIDLRNDMLSVADGKKKNKSISPSEIGIHPQTNEIFITDGPKSMLLIMDKSGAIKRFLQLGKDFVQPEGITFSPDGEMFISNEGAKQSGNIMQVEIK